MLPQGDKRGGRVGHPSAPVQNPSSARRLCHVPTAGGGFRQQGFPLRFGDPARQLGRVAMAVGNAISLADRPAGFIA